MKPIFYTRSHAPEMIGSFFFDKKYGKICRNMLYCFYEYKLRRIP